MANGMRIALVSYGVEEFSLLHETCAEAGHVPVVYAYNRSMRPRSPSDAHASAAASPIIQALPPGIDLVLPGSAEGMGRAFDGYRLDLAIVYGFNWKLPPDVLRMPRLGVINIHSSLLPRYRGPAPVLWAIRNGDPELGFTVHRMDEDFDTGPILAQRGGVPLEDDVTPERLRTLAAPTIRDLLTISLERLADGHPGEPQSETGASYASMLEPEFFSVDWSWTRRAIHNQVRTLRYIAPRNGPFAQIGDLHLRVLRTSLEPADGIQVDCADGPIWVIESEPAR